MNDEIIKIRSATENDLPVLYQFEQGVIAAERPFDTTLKAGPINYYDLHAMIYAAHIELVVAEVNGTIVGGGYARIETAKPYLKHSAYAYLGFMYVVPEQRGKGINKLVITALKKWAQLQNINELRLDVYFNNEAAIKAYEKIGFTRHMIEMRFNTEDIK